MKRQSIWLFRDRIDAGRQLGEELADRQFRNPLVLGIPRGGVVTGAALAREIGAELDVVLARKLRDPLQPEYALGAVSEDGMVFLNPAVVSNAVGERGMESLKSYLEQEKQYQMAEIRRRRELFRAVRPAAPIARRSVLVTDDGLATGSTMLAALLSIRTQEPYELIAAVPVAAPGRPEAIREYCDEVVCLQTPNNFYAVGQYYKSFEEVEDEEVVQLLREAVPQA